MKLIIDTDTGIDDAMGCVLALQTAHAEIVGFTSVFGNVDVDKTTRNTATLLEQLGRADVPLARGAARGFVGTPTFNPEVHGADGVGNAHFPEPVSVVQSNMSAAEFIIARARQYPGEVTFVGLGPLTNLALAVLLDPAIAGQLKRVVWMGGAIYAPGNVGPVAEADARHDPEAAQVVLDADWPVTIVSLDVTDNTLFRTPQLERLSRASSRAARYLQRIVPFYMDFYSPLLGEHACAMHSALTVGVTLNPDLITASEDLPVAMELNGALTRGMTVADRRLGHLHSSNRTWMSGHVRQVVRNVDRAAFIESFLVAIGA
jgi:purine nucleosidase